MGGRHVGYVEEDWEQQAEAFILYVFVFGLFMYNISKQENNNPTPETTQCWLTLKSPEKGTCLCHGLLVYAVAIINLIGPFAD